MRKTLAVTLALMMLIGTTTSFAASQFTDVKSSNWAYTYINKLTQDGGIKGYPDKSFRPQNTITVAEFVKTIVSIIDGEKAPLESDSHWASGYMLTATALELVPDGMFTKAEWDKPISRQKMGVIMERTAELFYQEETVTDQTKLNTIITGIKDYNSICQYCKDYIVQAVARGLITGYSDGTFKPEDTATRAEASTMIVRLIEKAYRTTEVKTDVVKEGTNLTDILPANVAKKVDPSNFMTKYVVLNNGDKFFLKYKHSNEKFYYVEYKIYGKVFALDKNMQIIEVSDPTNDWGTLLTQAFDGKLKDTAYFLFEDANEWTAYLVPNTLTE